MRKGTALDGFPEPEVYVFDICDTLFYSNTTFDFIYFVLENKKWVGRQRQFRLFTERKSPLFLGLYLLQKLTRVDWAKKMCLSLLKGLSKAELYQLGKDFQQQFLGSRRISQTHQMLEGFRAAGKPVVLISASIDPVVAAIAGQLGLDFHCSELEYNGQGLFTGRIYKEMTGKKLDTLRRLLSHQDAPFAVATDNFSDRSMVEAACQRYVVVYNEKAQKYWQDLDAEFIKLSS